MNWSPRSILALGAIAFVNLVGFSFIWPDSTPAGWSAPLSAASGGLMLVFPLVSLLFYGRGCAEGARRRPPPGRK